MSRLAAVILLSVASFRSLELVSFPTGSRLNLSATGFVDQSGKTCTVADFKGKVVVLDFWTVWCPACKIALPELVALQNDPTVQGKVVVVPCNCDTTRWPSDVKRFLEANSDALGKLTYYRSGSGPLSISANLPGGIVAYPTTLILDREGKLAAGWAGHAEGRLVDEVNRVLSEK